MGIFSRRRTEKDTEAEDFSEGFQAGLPPGDAKDKHRVDQSRSYGYQMGQLGRAEHENEVNDPTPLYWCKNCGCNRAYSHFPH